MNILIYSTKDFEKKYLTAANGGSHHLQFTESALSLSTAQLAKGYETISIFTGDDASSAVINELHAAGVKYIAVRATGYDNVDIARAAELGIKVANVPGYSPHAIAEHTVALMLALSRRLIIADQQVRRYDFTTGDLVGFNLHGKIVGIIGTGQIGGIVAKILHGFGCKLIGFDIKQNTSLTDQFNLQYADLETLCGISEIITIHTDLNDRTKHLIDKEKLGWMKNGVMLINTARGGIIDTTALIEALGSGRVAYAGLDVYEHEKGLFFYDHSNEQIKDKQLLQLIAMPNVIITPHQAFATQEALQNIARISFNNINCWQSGQLPANELKPVSKALEKRASFALIH